MSAHDVTRGPSEIGDDGTRTNVEDREDAREELLRLAEDLDAGDLDAAENRTVAFLSDIRRAKAGDAE